MPKNNTLPIKIMIIVCFINFNMSFLYLDILPILSCKVPIGHIIHHDLCLVATPKTIEIIVVTMHIDTKTAPIAIIFPPVLIIRNIKKLLNKINIIQRNQCLVKTLGTGFLKLALDMIISRNAPLGHRFQHQKRPLK